MIRIKKIDPKESVFGKSFDGKSNSDFYSIFDDNEYAGEIEYDVDESEILSIHIDNEFRGKGVGKIAVNKLFDFYNVDKIYAWAAKSSIPFWKKVSTKCIGNDIYVIEKQ